MAHVECKNRARNWGNKMWIIDTRYDFKKLKKFQYGEERK